MKKIVCIISCILLTLGLSACGGDVSGAETKSVDSEVYSQEDIDAAVDTIKHQRRKVWIQKCIPRKISMPRLIR